MRRSWLPALMTFCLLGVFLHSIARAGDEQILATVNGDRITMSDYRQFLLTIDPALVSEVVDEGLLKKLMRMRLILQEAARQEIGVTDEEVEKAMQDFMRKNNLTTAEFEKTIAEQGLKPSDYRKWLKENVIALVKIIDREVDGKTAVGDAEVKEYYERNRSRYRESQGTLQLKAILLKFHSTPSPQEATYLEIKAMKILADLRQGESFEKQAVLYSEDPSKKADGEFGEFRKGELAPAVERKLLVLSEGEVSEPLWLKEGIYIFKLAKRQGEKFAPFEKVKDDIRHTLLEQKREARYAEWIRSLWEKSDITITTQ
jgi:parvulin-like peptidyl-prolyl isomerase